MAAVSAIAHVNPRASLPGKERDGEERKADEEGTPAVAEPLAELPVMDQDIVGKMVPYGIGDMMSTLALSEFRW